MQKAKNDSQKRFDTRVRNHMSRYGYSVYTTADGYTIYVRALHRLNSGCPAANLPKGYKIMYYKHGRYITNGRNSMNVFSFTNGANRFVGLRILKVGQSCHRKH